jgi:hypothetical protein
MPSQPTRRCGGALLLGPLALGLALGSLACSGDEPVATTPSSTAASRAHALDAQTAPATQGHYPLEPGWQWTYEHSFRAFNAAGDLEFESSATSMVWTMGEVELEGMPVQGIAARTVETAEGKTSEYYDEVYYVQDRKTLTEVAYRLGGGIGVMPEPSPGEDRSPRYRIGARTFVSLTEIPRAIRLLSLGLESSREQASTSPAEEGEIVLRDDPRLALVYPLRPRQAWVSFEDPFLETREVVRRGSVELPAGRFGAAEVLSRIPSLEVEFTDWVSQTGLVARYVQVEITSEDPEEPLTAVERSELVSFQRPSGPRPDARRP